MQKNVAHKDRQDRDKASVSVQMGNGLAQHGTAQHRAD
jgi:hypothetical protein